MSADGFAGPAARTDAPPERQVIGESTSPRFRRWPVRRRHMLRSRRATFVIIKLFNELLQRGGRRLPERRCTRDNKEVP
nr:hypothetical protein [Bradyrhizobium oligotrophicum]